MESTVDKQRVSTTAMNELSSHIMGLKKVAAANRNKSKKKKETNASIENTSAITHVLVQ